MEHAILVADAVAVGRQRQGGQRVQEAGREPSQAAIAETSIPLRFAQVFELVAEFVHRLRRRVEKPEIHEAVSQGTPHQELQRQVVDALGIVGVIGLLGADPALDETVAHGEREAEIGLPFGVHVLWQLRQRDLKVGQELPPDGVGVQAIDVRLLQVLRCEDWSRSGGCSHHATPFYILTSIDYTPHSPHACRTPAEIPLHHVTSTLMLGHIMATNLRAIRRAAAGTKAACI